MRINAPQRPGQDPGAAAQQQWRWLYQLTEQLNMVLEQLEGRGVIDLQVQGSDGSGPQGGSAAAQGGEIAALQSGQQSLQQGLTDVETDVKALQKDSGGYGIRIGTASIAFGAASTAANVSFGTTFASPPTVLVSQVFDSVNLFVKNEAITTTGFVAGLPGGLASSGTRSFRWAAIGQLKE